MHWNRPILTWNKHPQFCSNGWFCINSGFSCVRATSLYPFYLMALMRWKMITCDSGGFFTFIVEACEQLRCLRTVDSPFESSWEKGCAKEQSWPWSYRYLVTFEKIKCRNSSGRSIVAVGLAQVWRSLTEQGNWDKHRRGRISVGEGDRNGEAPKGELRVELWHLLVTKWEKWQEVSLIRKNNQATI